VNVSHLTSWVLSFVRVVGSTVVGKHSAVLVGGDGAVGSNDADDPGFESADPLGEKVTDAEQYSALGLVFRPRPPETVAGDLLAAEAMAVRTGGGLVPIAWRDLRLNRRFSAPKPGSVALVGYGGAFLAFDDTVANSGSEKASKTTLYVPYQFSNGAPTKALTIALDPEQESISIIHANGAAVVLDKDNHITMRADGSTWLSVKPGKIELVAASISARGNVALGANTATAVPLLPGATSQPTFSIFFSPV
jgi:hypothetical protein